MKNFFSRISAFALIWTFLMPSCSNDGYTPMQATSKSCNIEIEFLDQRGNDLLAEKSFADNISVEGNTSHSTITHSILRNGTNSRLCFEADIPERGDMKWSADKTQASGISHLTVKYGKQKAKMKCYFKFTANRPPAAIGGTLILESVEYNNRSYSRTGNSVPMTIKATANK